jgi:hypothetical protein
MRCRSALESFEFHALSSTASAKRNPIIAPNRISTNYRIPEAFILARSQGAELVRPLMKCMLGLCVVPRESDVMAIHS